MSGQQKAGAIAELYKAGMRRLASGVSLITSTDADGSRVGLIATAVNSVSMEPPTLLICVNQTASAHDVIAASGHFCVNMLTADSIELADQFSSSSRRAERFTTGAWTRLRTGSPVLQDSLVAFDCGVVQQIRYGTHSIFLGEVRAVQLEDSDVAPLLYMDRQFRHAVLEATGA